MVVSVIDKAKYSKFAIAYHLNKIKRGVGSFLSNDPEKNIALINKYEGNPYLWPSASNLGVHIIFSPAEEEKIDDSNIIELVHFVLIILGLEEQPYIIVKHTDMAVVHYHVCSTRAKIDGHILPIRYLKHFQKEVKNYFIEHGLNYVSKTQRLCLNPDNFLFDSKLRKTEQFDYAFVLADFYNYSSFEEFALILQSFRIGVMISSKKKNKCLLFTGLDENYKPCTHLYSHIDPYGALYKIMLENCVSNKKAGLLEPRGFSFEEEIELIILLIDRNKSYEAMLSDFLENGLTLVEKNTNIYGQGPVTSWPVIIDSKTQFILNSKILEDHLPVSEFEKLLGPDFWVREYEEQDWSITPKKVKGITR